MLKDDSLDGFSGNFNSTSGQGLRMMGKSRGQTVKRSKRRKSGEGVQIQSIQLEWESKIM